MFRVILLFLLCGRAAMATMTPTVRKVMSTSLAQLSRNAQRSIRNLQDEQCFSDSMDLYERNPVLQEASSAFEAEYSQAVEGCGSLVCTIDEDGFRAAPFFVIECEAAGGEIYEYNLMLGCIIGNGEEIHSVQVSYLNVDHCLAPQSCDQDAIANRSREEANTDLDEFQTALSSGGVSVACHVEYSVNDLNDNVIVEGRIQGSPSRSDHLSLSHLVAGAAAMFAAYMIF